MLAQEALQLATKLSAALAQPLSLSGQPFNLTCSIGIALSEATNPNSQDVLRWADLAMYSVKESGRNGFRFFKGEMNAEALRWLALETRLRRALDQAGREALTNAIGDQINTGEPPKDDVDVQIIGISPDEPAKQKKLCLLPSGARK